MGRFPGTQLVSGISNFNVGAVSHWVRGQNKTESKTVKKIIVLFLYFLNLIMLIFEKFLFSRKKKFVSERFD